MVTGTIKIGTDRYSHIYRVTWSLGDSVTMAKIKFDRQEELDELVARIYLDTKRRLSKKELLEAIFEVGTRDYQALLALVREPPEDRDATARARFIERVSGALSLPGSGDDAVDAKSIWERGTRCS